MIAEAANKTVHAEKVATDAPTTDAPTTDQTAKTAKTAEKATEKPATQSSGNRYRWLTGDCLANYGNSAKLWTEFSSTDEFAAGFMAIVVNEKDRNDMRAARVEEYLLEQATKAGVLDVSSTRRKFINPNKWDKHLAPSPQSVQSRGKSLKGSATNTENAIHTQSRRCKSSYNAARQAVPKCNSNCRKC